MFERVLGWLFKREQPPVEDGKWSMAPVVPPRPNVRSENPLKGRMRVAFRGNGSFAFDIVGEASHQDALEALAGKKTRDSKALRCVATVSPEPANPHDPNAVVVEIGGRKVGYFGKSDAKDYASQLKGSGGGTSEVAAMIVGGFKSKTKEGHFGVKLDLTRHS